MNEIVYEMKYDLEEEEESWRSFSLSLPFLTCNQIEIVKQNEKKPITLNLIVIGKEKKGATYIDTHKFLNR
jgi:hypothetical protein